jgi:hypothetical protein
MNFSPSAKRCHRASKKTKKGVIYDPLDWFLPGCMTVGSLRLIFTRLYDLLAEIPDLHPCSWKPALIYHWFQTIPHGGRRMKGSFRCLAVSTDDLFLDHREDFIIVCWAWSADSRAEPYKLETQPFPWINGTAVQVYTASTSGTLAVRWQNTSSSKQNNFNCLLI